MQVRERRRIGWAATVLWTAGAVLLAGAAAAAGGVLQRPPSVTGAGLQGSGLQGAGLQVGTFQGSEFEGAQPLEETPNEGPRVPLEVTIDKSSVDLEKHRLELRMSRPAGHVRISVFAATGATLAEREIDFSGRPANARLVVTWEPKSDEPVAKIELYAYDADGYYKGVAIVPWSLEIPHEEVVFETNSAAIQPEEEPKLEQSLKEIQRAFDEHKDLGNVALFIAGHTDTRGSSEHNRSLSRRRARAIAQWFRKHGLTMPIAYEGFGEHAPKVKTADEVDEPKNRRVDYVLSVEPPRLKSTGAPAAWKKI